MNLPYTPIRVASCLLAMAIALVTYQMALPAEERKQDSETTQTTVNHTTDLQAVNTLLRSGISMVRAGDIAGAEKTFRQVVRTDPANTNAWFNLGVIAEQKGDLQAALKDYRCALRQDPGDKELQAAESQVRVALQNQGRKPVTDTGLSASKTETIVNTDVMPPRAPAFAVSCPVNKTRYQSNLVSQHNSFRQAVHSENTQTNIALRRELMRTTLGIARLLHYDTCSLCGLLRR